MHKGFMMKPHFRNQNKFPLGGNYIFQQSRDVEIIEAQTGLKRVVKQIVKANINNFWRQN